MRSEGYYNSVSRYCGVLNTNCVKEADQGVVKVHFKEDNATASQEGTLALHEEEKGDPILIRCWEVEESASHIPSAVRMVYADASCTGYAGYTVEHSCYIAHGPWTAEDATCSSTW